MYNWEVKGNDIVVYDITNFNPIHVFECGQCFRWNSLGNNRWFGVAKGHALELEWDGNNLVLHDTTDEQFLKIWSEYFDLNRDYDYIKSKLSENDPVMAEAIEFGWGIRLLKQDFSEMAISFLISQNNGIPRIKKIIESLSASFGESISYAGKTYYSFPSLERLSRLSCDDLKVIRAGYRDKYIIKTAQQLTTNEVDMKTILEGDNELSRKEILKLFGVGEKVADCILLFSGTRYDIFPVDRWVKRVMAELYLGYEASYDELRQFASERYGELAGFAQQYLFYYAREKKIGI
ncbi:MAG: DNA-3-methyladenine glycosylase 2 family protein [Clostridiaceae bacterium]|nr:DNA-3-methyladenine glycosylase 2 family protein [Clostridiaceae bacterium]